MARRRRPEPRYPLLIAAIRDRCRLTAGQLDLACPAVYDLYVHGYAIGVEWLVENRLRRLQLMDARFCLSRFLAHGYLIDDVGSGVSGTLRFDLVDPDKFGWSSCRSMCS